MYIYIYLYIYIYICIYMYMYIYIYVYIYMYIYINIFREGKRERNIYIIFRLILYMFIHENSIYLELLYQYYFNEISVWRFILLQDVLLYHFRNLFHNITNSVIFKLNMCYYYYIA